MARVGKSSFLYGVLVEAVLVGVFAGIRRMMFVPAESPIAMLFGLTQFPGILLALFYDAYIRESMEGLFLVGMAIAQSLTFTAIIHICRTICQERKT